MRRGRIVIEDTSRSFEPEMILIPGGEFLMGYELIKVYLPDYYIAKTPITNAQYLVFMKNASYQPPEHWREGKPPRGKENHPVGTVSWHDTINYCEWLAGVTGKPYRLPTEAEWEKAARGTDGRAYPWGKWDAERCNTLESGILDTTPVGKYSPEGDSPYGCADMAGNVWEWTASEKGTAGALRGGSWVIHRQRATTHCRSYGDGPIGAYYVIGFRCAHSLP
jgi:formylglycine-generating enzyme required for sulfatase activity